MYYCVVDVVNGSPLGFSQTLNGIAAVSLELRTKELVTFAEMFEQAQTAQKPVTLRSTRVVQVPLDQVNFSPLNGLPTVTLGDADYTVQSKEAYVAAKERFAVAFKRTQSLPVDHMQVNRDINTIDRKRREHEHQQKFGIIHRVRGN